VASLFFSVDSRYCNHKHYSKRSLPSSHV
jgi:hypothetical protein